MSGCLSRRGIISQITKATYEREKKIFSSLLTGATIIHTNRFCISMFLRMRNMSMPCSRDLGRDCILCRHVCPGHVSTCLVSGTVRTGAIQNHRHCRERALLGIVPAMATAVLYFLAFACSLQLGKVSTWCLDILHLCTDVFYPGPALRQNANLTSLYIPFLS